MDEILSVGRLYRQLARGEVRHGHGNDNAAVLPGGAASVIRHSRSRCLPLLERKRRLRDLIAESGARRTTFRADAERDSGVMSNTIPG